MTYHIDPDLNEKYHELFKSKSFNKKIKLLLENPYARDNCMQIIQIKYSINNNKSYEYQYSSSKNKNSSVNRD